MAMIADALANEIDDILAIPKNAIAIGTRWAKVAAALTLHGASYEQVLHPRELFVHPDNRSRLGLNQHNVHRNLRRIALVGADGSKLVGAAAFELSGEPKERERQTRFNLNLIQQAKGMLAPPTGHERFITVATGHVAAGCRAVHAKCPSSATKLCDPSDGTLSYETCSCNDPALRAMLDKGWAFMCVP